MYNKLKVGFQVNYAKRVVGRKMYGGQNTHIPIKVAMAGVMPINICNVIYDVSKYNN